MCVYVSVRPPGLDTFPMTYSATHQVNRDGSWRWRRWHVHNWRGHFRRRRFRYSTRTTHHECTPLLHRALRRLGSLLAQQNKKITLSLRQLCFYRGCRYSFIIKNDRNDFSYWTEIEKRRVYCTPHDFNLSPN